MLPEETEGYNLHRGFHGRLSALFCQCVSSKKSIKKQNKNKVRLGKTQGKIWSQNTNHSPWIQIAPSLRFPRVCAAAASLGKTHRSGKKETNPTDTDWNHTRSVSPPDYLPAGKWASIKQQTKNDMANCKNHLIFASPGNIQIEE